MFSMPLVRKAFATLLLGCILCQGESPSHTLEIRVRAMDYKTGRPVIGHRIAILLSDSTGQITLHQSEGLIRSTDEDGRAVFQVKEPLPPKVSVDTNSLADWNCSAAWGLSTSEILQHGIVGQYTLDTRWCKKKRSPPVASPVPGEVVIYVRQLGAFDRLYRLFY
jgi:hypothetical protein